MRLAVVEDEDMSCWCSRNAHHSPVADRIISMRFAVVEEAHVEAREPSGVAPCWFSRDVHCSDRTISMRLAVVEEARVEARDSSGVIWFSRAHRAYSDRIISMRRAVV